MLEIRNARLPDDLACVSALVEEYAIGLCSEFNMAREAAFPTLEIDMAQLVDRYAAPRGGFFLAYLDNVAVGCSAIRPFDVASCELKRLYVCPHARGRHIASQLTEAACDFAANAGYSQVRVHTWRTQTAAVRLYEKAGFREIPVYVAETQRDSFCMARDLPAIALVA